MPNIASVLKDEISRVARKEVRAETESLKKASAQYRSDIAALKKRATELEKVVSRLGKAVVKNTPVSLKSESTPEPAPRLRFSAKRLAAQRQKLGLSAANMGVLLGVSGQTIYHWEAGKSRPRQSQLPAIAAVRGIGKNEAAARLKELAG